MDSSLTPWLVDNVSISLHLGRQWFQDKLIKKQESRKANPDRAWSGLYFDDGSSLFIFDAIRPELNSNLQIVRRDPLTLTDGEASIVATYARCLDEKLARLNSIVSIHRYTIRYTAYGPPLENVSIVLDTVVWHAEGQTRDGSELKPVTDFAEIGSALQNLREIRALNDRRCFLSTTDREDSTMAGGGDDGIMSRPSSPNTQMPYATQMVPTSRGQDGAQRTAARQLEPVMRSFPPREKLPSTTTGSTKAQKEAKLLSLLRLPGPSVPTADGVVRTATTDKNEDVNETSVASARPNSSKNQSPCERQHSDPPQSESPRSRGEKTDTERADVACGKARALDTEVAIERRPRQEQILDEADSVPSYHEGLENHEPEWLKGRRPILGSAKISSRQRLQLDRKEAWFQHPRFPDANIPIEIFEAIKDRLRSSGEGNPTASVISASVAPSPSTRPDDEGVLPDAEEVHDEESTASQTSWIETPSPEPPRRPSTTVGGLPPDSSFSPKKTQMPVLIDLSDDQSNKDPPSSPPINDEDNDSDDEMEMDVPLGLGEEPSAASPEPARPAVVVQVKETPYSKCKTGIALHLEHEQSSGEASKNTSSGSVVYGTYMEAISPGHGRAVQVGTDMPPPPLYAVGAKSTVDDDTPLKASVESPKISFSTSELVDDVPMDDAADIQPNTADSSDDDDLYSHPRPRKPYNDMPMSDLRAPQQISADDRGMPLAQLEPTPISAQQPGPYLSSSGEPVPAIVPGSKSTLMEAVVSSEAAVGLPDAPHLKRKLDNSPSKKSVRQTKRRELKIPDFRVGPSITNTAAELRQAKKDSERRFREDKRSEPSITAVANDTQNRHLLSDGHAGAEERQMPAAPKTDHRSCSSPVPSDAATRSSAKQRLLNRQGPHSEDGADSAMSSVEPREKLEHLSLGHQNELQSFDSSSNGENSDNSRKLSSSIHQAGSRYPSHKEVDQFEITDLEPAVSLSGSLVASTSFPTLQKDHTQSPLSVSKHSPNSETMFQKFRAAYPEYTANDRQFLGTCKQVYKLEQEDKMVPKWQWDDFIIRRNTDYTRYRQECDEEGEEPEPYHRFYKDNIRNTLYTRGIIDSKRTLQVALQELGAQPTPVTTPVPAPAARSFDGALQSAARKFSQKSVHEGPKQRSKDFDAERIKGTARPSLPTGYHSGIAASSTAPPTLKTSHRSLSLSTADSATSFPRVKPQSSKAPSSKPSRFSTLLAATSSGPSTPATSHRTINGSTFSTGDPYRDYLTGASRVTSLTGDKSFDATKAWPRSIEARRQAGVRRKRYDVLGWGDVL